MKKTLWIVVAVVTVYACSDAVGEGLRDAGQAMMDAGDAMMPDAGAQTAAQCDRTYTDTGEGGVRIEYSYAVVRVNNPRNVVVESCWPSGHFSWLPPNVRCQSIQHALFDGNDFYIGCGSKTYDAEGALIGENPGPVSITVYE